MEGPGIEAIAKVAGLGFRVQASGGPAQASRTSRSCGALPGVVGAISGKALLDGALSLGDPAVRSAFVGEKDSPRETRRARSKEH